MSVLISTVSMGEGWVNSLKCIVDEGHDIFDEDVKLREYISLILEVSNPYQADTILKDIWTSKYSYNSETVSLFDYKARLVDYTGVDQLSFIEDRLNKKPESKSATAITLLVGKDIEKIPCLIAVDFKIRNNKILTQAFFRSQDVWNKQPLNLLFLEDIASSLADKLNASLGSITLYIASAHIYEKDLHNAMNLIQKNHGE